MPSSTTKRKNSIEALRRVWAHHFLGEDPTGIVNNPACLNSGTYSGEYVTGESADGTTEIPMIGVDGNNNVVFPGNNIFSGNLTLSEINGQYINPAMLKTVTFNLQNNASLGTQTFFIADRAYTVTAISYVQKTQGTVAGATVAVTHDTGTQAPGAGTSLQTTAFDCHATANATVVNATLTATTSALTLAAGDRLSALFAGTLTTLAGVVITVTLSPSSLSETAQYYINVNGDVATQNFFVANRDMVITGVSAIFATAFAAGATLQITHDTGTSAPGAGTSILGAAIAIDGTGSAINTVINPALAASATTLLLNAGDRLSVKFSATTTGTGVCVTVAFQPIYNRAETSFQLALNGQQQVSQYFFIADRAYEIVDASCTFGTAAGGAADIAVTIDKGTSAPGTGNITQTDNTNAGFNLNATANTVQFFTPATLHLRLLSKGDRLGLKVTGAAQSIADVAITCSLRPNY